jgi:DnaJ-class molecular chaperone
MMSDQKFCWGCNGSGIVWKNVINKDSTQIPVAETCPACMGTGKP